MKTSPSLLLPLLAITALLLGHSLAAEKKPLKVFILAGQSNMEGHARIETFDYVGDDPATAPLLKMMRDADGKPRVADHVWISYLTGKLDGSANGEGISKLTAGEEPKITLSLANIPLSEALRNVAQLAGYEIVADEHAITLRATGK